MNINYIPVQAVIDIHDWQISKHGGSSGIRDLSLIESAVMRPQNGYYNDNLERAAALWESLSNNHAFIDGNKRTAFFCVDLFLQANGYSIVASNDEAVNFIENNYENKTFKFDVILGWLIKNTIQI